MPSAPQFNPNSFASNILPTSTVELSVKCSDLANKDLMSYSDPVCIMFIQKQGQWFELGRTEKIKDTLNPAWEKRFVVDYSFEERQIVKFEVYDWDMDSTNLGIVNTNRPNKYRYNYLMYFLIFNVFFLQVITIFLEELKLR